MGTSVNEFWPDLGLVLDEFPGEGEVIRWVTLGSSSAAGGPGSGGRSGGGGRSKRRERWVIRSLPPSLYDDLVSLALRAVFFGRTWGGRTPFTTVQTK